MYKEVLRSIEGVEFFPMISFLVFFVFFIGLMIFVLTRSKEHIKHMSEIPLSDVNQGSLTSKKEKSC